MAKNNQKTFSKAIWSYYCAFALGFFLLSISAQPARAEFVTDIPAEASAAISAGISQLEWAWTQVQDQIKEGQTAWAATINGIGQSLQARIATMTADTANTNNRTNVQVATAEAIALKYAEPTNKRHCPLAQKKAAAAEVTKTNHAIAQAVANGGANRPATPAAVAADINAEEQSGLTHCSGATTGNNTDTEASVDKALNCTDPYNGRWNGANETMSAIFDTLQFPIAQNYSPPINGVYQSIPTAETEQDMPFIAALSFCNHINDRLPPAPQAVAKHATVDALAIDAYRDMKAAVTAAYTMCIDDVFERTQYLNNAQMDPRFVANNTNQATECQDDVTNGILDSMPTYQYYDTNGNPTFKGTCVTLGRSELQAKFDYDWRNKSQNYQTIYLVGLTPDRKNADDADANREQTALDEYISGEKTALVNAMAVAKESAKIYSSALSQPVATP